MLSLIVMLALMQTAPAVEDTLGRTQSPSYQAAKPESGPDLSVPEVTVSTRRDTPARTMPAAPEYLRRFCFEPGRKTSRFAPPQDDDPDWFPLEDALRERFGASDPAVPAFRFDDVSRNQTVLVRFETMSASSGITEQRCIFAIVGKINEPELRSGLSRLFGTSGTQRHVDVRDGGVPSIPGWDQWLWTGSPARGSRAWPGFSPRDSFIIVTNSSYFYDGSDYIYADLKVRKDRSVAMMSFGFKTRSLPPPKPEGRQSSP